MAGDGADEQDHHAPQHPQRNDIGCVQFIQQHVIGQPCADEDRNGIGGQGIAGGDHDVA